MEIFIGDTSAGERLGIALLFGLRGVSLAGRLKWLGWVVQSGGGQSDVLRVEVAGVLAAEELAEANPDCCLHFGGLEVDEAVEEGDRFVGIAGWRAPAVLAEVAASRS